MNNVASLYFDEKNITLDLIAGGRSFNTFTLLIDEWAAKSPDRTAIKFNSDCWSYGRVCGYANQLARLLLNSGIQKGDIVALALDRSPEMIVALLAILKCGAAYVPLDPVYPKERVEFMLSDSSSKLLLTSKKYQKHFVSNVTELLIEDIQAQLDNYSQTSPETEICSGDTAYILYTSGSTGKPKGVVVTHGNLANFLASMQKAPGIDHNDRLLAISTISFDIAGFELYLPLISGAQIVLASAETAKDGWLLLQLVEQESITIMQATPYTWRMLIAAGWEKFMPLKVITGGEQLPRDLGDKLLPRCSELWNQYGPTETTVYSTQKLITDSEHITIGKPIANTGVYILNESLQKQPVGTTGEIFIGGAGVAKGYLNRAELTSERFIDDPFSLEKNAKLYRTGDLGRLTPDGEIQCLGRIDHQVKIRGFRIELEEIEYALLKAENVKAAVATILSDGPGDPRLIACVVPVQPADAESEKARFKQRLSEILPAYMVPDDFVFLSSIPVTPNGKVDRKALPTPESATEVDKNQYVAPETETEKQLAAIWEKLMRKPKISIHDNFFSLGGHSLVAVQIMARVAKITGKHLPISMLLKYPTIARLALHLNDDNSQEVWNSLVPIRPTGSKTPLYVIHGEGLNVMYFNDLVTNMDPDQPVYGLQARGLKGEPPLEVMEEIAAKYIEEILVQNPEGPYLLAGYSFGGYVAVEMRKQLKAMGKDVKLIIFDTDAEKSEYKSQIYLLPKKVKRHLPRVISLAKSTLSNPAAAFKQTLKKIREKSDSNEKPAEFYRQIKRIKGKLRIALRNYSIEPFDDKVYLYRAGTCTHYVDDKEFLGWRKYAKNGVEICEVSGDHLSMLLHPYVKDFAVKLQQGINNFKGHANAN